MYCSFRWRMLGYLSFNLTHALAIGLQISKFGTQMQFGFVYYYQNNPQIPIEC